MFLIVGLGNPGPEYKDSRHNLGFAVIDDLGARLAIASFKLKHRSFVGEGKMGEHKILLAQPQTFMNNSGPAVKGILAWHKIGPERLILIYDDVDLEAGQIRVRERGSAAGHHGVESVITSLGTSEFARIRLGVGRDDLAGDVSDYVLQKVPPAQREILAAAVMTAADAAQAIVTSGLPAAMNKFNGNP